ncbi:MAG: hypothetical protein EU539_06140 [Promethearchaeota archaeon]|nr:MAG: hypothetical protein EU539_06140 [Candidatus Lokiarchaeota archaeon]
MSEEITREIIGLTRKSKWNQLKGFIRNIIKETLKRNAGYSLVALDAQLGSKKRAEYNSSIKSKRDTEKIMQIRKFSNLSLYQYSNTSSDHISLSQNGEVITFIAKYFGPSLNYQHYFDFSIHLDAISDPVFSNGNGKALSSSEFLKSINNHVKDKKKKSKPRKKTTKKQQRVGPEDIEKIIFEKLHEKKAIWGGSETKKFKKWKGKISAKYHDETGNNAYYRGKPTRNFQNYLNSLSKKKSVQKKSLKKKGRKKGKKIQKKQVEISEAVVFETLKDKKAIWGGKETKSFQKWKNRISQEYRKETGAPTHYREKLTKNYKAYLGNLMNGKAK